MVIFSEMFDLETTVYVSCLRDKRDNYKALESILAGGIGAVIVQSEIFSQFHKKFPKISAFGVDDIAMGLCQAASLFSPNFPGINDNLL